MRGVRKSKDKYYIASYGKDLNKSFSSYEKACEQRKEWELLYGIPQSGNRADRQEEVIGNFTIIGDTGENKGKDQKILVRNNLTGRLDTSTYSAIKNKIKIGNEGIGKIQKNNKSGVPGVRKYKGKWRATIGINGIRYFLGDYDKKEQAVKARIKAEEEYFKFGKVPTLKSELKELPKNISLTENGTFRVSFQKNGVRNRKTFKTLNEAKIYIEKHNKQKETIKHDNI